MAVFGLPGRQGGRWGGQAVHVAASDPQGARLGGQAAYHLVASQQAAAACWPLAAHGSCLRVPGHLVAVHHAVPAVACQVAGQLGAADHGPAVPLEAGGPEEAVACGLVPHQWGVAACHHCEYCGSSHGVRTLVAGRRAGEAGACLAAHQLAPSAWSVPTRRWGVGHPLEAAA